MTTRRDVEADIIRNLVNAGLDQALLGLPMPLAPTTRGTTTTIIDTKLARGTRDANYYDGRAIRITKASAGGSDAGEDEISMVSQGGFSGSTITINPALTNPVDTDQEYLMYPLGFAPETVLEAIQHHLRVGDVPQLYVPSLVTNHMLDSVATGGALTDWNETGTVSQTNTAPTITPASAGPFGGRAVTLTVSDAGGIYTDHIVVVPGEELFVSVMVQPQSADDITVALLDENDDLTIESTTVEYPGEVASGALGVFEVRFRATMPADCDMVSLHITIAGAGTFDVYSPVIIQPTRARFIRIYDMPVTREAQLVGAFRAPDGQQVTDQTAATEIFVPLSGGLVELRNLPQTVRNDMAFGLESTHLGHRDTGGESETDPDEFQVSDAAYGNNISVLVDADGSGPLILRVMAPPGEAQRPDSSLIVDRRWLGASVTATLLGDIGHPMASRWRQIARSRTEAMGYGKAELRMEDNPTLALGPS